MSNTLVEKLADATSTVVEPLTIEQYHAMIREGILVEGAPIELVDGLLVRIDRRDKEGDIMTVGPRHTLMVGHVADLLRALLATYIRDERFHVREQQPITLNGMQEPEPDVAVAVGKRSDYPGHHPGPGTIPLVIEVADSSLETDCGRKCEHYATAGIPHYWVINLRDNRVQCYVQPRPTNGEYCYSTSFQKGHTLSFECAGQTFELSVDDIFA